MNAEIIVNADNETETVTCGNTVNILSATGTLTLDVLNGIPPYNYLWIFPNASIQNIQTITFTVPGYYNCLIRDSIGDNLICGINLELEEPLVSRIQVIGKCIKTYDCGSFVNLEITSNSFLKALPINGTAPYNYFWLLPSGAGSNNQIINIVSEGVYQVTIKDSSPMQLTNVCSIIIQSCCSPCTQVCNI